MRVEVIHADGLPGVGYIHSLTCEEDFRKPEDYTEEAVAKDAEDPYAGLKSCDMEVNVCADFKFYTRRVAFEPSSGACFLACCVFFRTLRIGSSPA